jgi:hypothetical protein
MSIAHYTDSKFDRIWSIVAHRRDSDSPQKRMMLTINQLYHGDWMVPLYDVDGEQTRKSTIPSLITDAIDNLAMSAASTVPTITVPAMRDAQQAVKSAEVCTTALQDSWRTSSWMLHRRRVFRHMTAYGTASVVVRPDYKSGRGRLQVMNPLTAYPDERAIELLDPPRDCAWVSGMTRKQLCARFPEAKSMLDEYTAEKFSDPVWDVFEWVDEDDIIMGILGPRVDGWQQGAPMIEQSQWRQELRRFPNRAFDGMVPCYSPARVTLQRISGALDHLVGHVEEMARMNALMEVAIEKGIFPDTYILASTDRPAMLVGNRWKDGRSGEVNLIQNADSIGQLQSNVGFQTPQQLDRIERGFRVSSGLDPRFGGETGGAALRTGRAIDTMAGFSIDPRTQELHETDEIMMTHLHSAVLAVDKGYFPTRKTYVFSGSTTSRKGVEYIPGKHVEHLYNGVEYPMAGADISQLTVGISQMLGSGLADRELGRAMHPYIKDKQETGRRVLIERMEEALLQSQLAQAQQGALPAIDLARQMQLVEEGMSLVDAVIQCQKEAQERQAALAPAGAPETMPGLALPGAGAESGALPAPEPGKPGPQMLQEMLDALRAQPGGPPAEGGTPVFAPQSGQLPAGVAV